MRGFVSLAPPFALQGLDEGVSVKLETRKFAVERKGEAKALVFHASISSEYPVLRHWGWEILSHDAAAVDLSRAADGLPLLANHNHHEPVGMAENLRLVNGKLRANLRFFSTSKGREYSTMVSEGLRGVSLSYEINDMVNDGDRDGDPVYRVTRFTPYEVSIAPVAADPTVGVGRSRSTLRLNKSRVMSMTTEHDEHDQANSSEIRAERARATEMIRIGNQYGQADLAERFIQQGRSVDDLMDVVKTIASQAPAMREQESRDYGSLNVNTGGMSAALCLSSRDLDGYSLVRAIRASMDPKYMREAGFEMEVSQALASQTGRRSKGLLVPLDALHVRSVQKLGTGGELVPTEHMGSAFVDVLRARSFVMNMSTVLQGLSGDVTIPRKASSAAPYWIAGDDADALTDSDPTFDQIALTPHTVGALTRFSHKMLVQSSPDIEMLVRMDLADTVAVGVDLEVLQGGGTANKPKGLLPATPGSFTYANGATPDNVDIVGLEGALAASNADMGNLAYLTTPQLAMALKTTDVGTDTGRFVWSSGRERGQGSMNGLPAFYTSNMPAGYVMLANWRDVLVGLWGMLEIDVNPYGTNFAKGSVEVRALMDVDVALRHAESVVEIHEAAS
ncbi:phage major capsid protein [Thiosocius teredinicola]|uniref:phage major capsid protein n=1 Tax=Thiosocius teredinicola TaxID=1973002 RepID=UPI000990F308